MYISVKLQSNLVFLNSLWFSWYSDLLYPDFPSPFIKLSWLFIASVAKVLLGHIWSRVLCSFVYGFVLFILLYVLKLGYVYRLINFHNNIAVLLHKYMHTLCIHVQSIWICRDTLHTSICRCIKTSLALQDVVCIFFLLFLLMCFCHSPHSPCVQRMLAASSTPGLTVLRLILSTHSVVGSGMGIWISLVEWRCTWGLREGISSMSRGRKKEPTFARTR